MSLTGIEAFDSTIHKTNVWLKDLNDVLHWDDRHDAYTAFRAVLHALRDRLPIVEAAQLGDQMPMLMRGLYYEGWNPKPGNSKALRHGPFLEQVLAHFGKEPDADVEEIVLAVFNVLEKHISEGEIDDLKAVLPQELRDLWLEEELLVRC